MDPKNTDPVNGEDLRPAITAREAQLRETVAGVQAEKRAAREGGDPRALGALMNQGAPPPEVCGYTLLGIQGDGMTAACLTALQLLAATKEWQPATQIQGSVATLLCYIDPIATWDALVRSNLEALVNNLIRERGLTMAQIGEISTAIARYCGVATEEPEEDESFTKPAETPATP